MKYAHLLTRNLFRGNPMRLHSGTFVDFDKLDSLEVNYSDIELVLPRINRFNGHTLNSHVWSVAAHSVIVSMLCPTIETKIWGLLHDAEEVYTCDLPTKLKEYVNTKSGGAYTCLQEAVSTKIINTLCSNIVITSEHKQLVKLIDNLVNGIEYDYLMCGGILPDSFAVRHYFVEFEKDESNHCFQARKAFRQLAKEYGLV